MTVTVLLSTISPPSYRERNTSEGGSHGSFRDMACQDAHDTRRGRCATQHQGITTATGAPWSAGTVAEVQKRLNA